MGGLGLVLRPHGSFLALKMKACSNKDCIHGGTPQPLSEFYERKDGHSADGHRGACKSCMRPQGAARTRKYRATPHGKKATKENNRRYYNTEKGKAHSRLKSQKRRANIYGVDATLTQEQWEDILEQYGGKCAYCRSSENITQEHIVPLSKGGAYTANNIIPACWDCNYSKRDKSLIVWMSERI